MKTDLVGNLVFASLTVLAALAASARGGSVSGGDGGHGVYCPRARSARVQLLDLYEARRSYHAHFAYSMSSINLSEAEMLHEALQAAQSRFYELMAHDAQANDLFQVFKSFDDNDGRNPLRFGLGVPATADFGQLKVKIPQGCRLMQLGYSARSQEGRNLIYVNAETWDSLANVDQASLLLHEAFHPYFPNADTVALRQFTQYLAADKKFRRRNADLFRQLVRTRQAIPNYR